jgi:hypothetical protein
MTAERFIQIVEAYGADPARWPEAERAAAQAFADAHPQIAADALAAEAALDAMLGEAEAVPSDLLERRIMKRLPVPAAAPRWQVPAAAAAALLVGAFIGFASGALTVTDGAQTAETTLYADAYAGLDEDWIAWLGDDV